MDKTYKIILESKYHKGLIYAQERNGEWYLNGKKLVKSSYRVLYSEREEAEAVSEWDKLAKEGNNVWLVCSLLLAVIAVLYLAP